MIVVLSVVLNQSIATLVVVLDSLLVVSDVDSEVVCVLVSIIADVADVSTVSSVVEALDVESVMAVLIS